MTGPAVQIRLGRMQAGAILSADGQYRYLLWRRWNTFDPALVWVMLNPSTADASTDDNSSRRCISFSRSWGFGGIYVVNLYALRSTDPRALLKHPDPIGPENDRHIRDACMLGVSTTVVCAWGVPATNATHRRARKVRNDVYEYRGQPWCLGHTKQSYPKHPLYVPADTRLERFR